MVFHRRVSITEYEDASLVTYNLGGTELLLNLPPHQELSKLRFYLAPSDIDIFDMSGYKGSLPPDEAYLLLVKTIWYCTLAGSAYDAGTMILTVSVVNNVPGENYDFLDETSFSDWMLSRIGSSFMELDKPNLDYLTENNIPITESDYSIYPKKREELIKINKGGVNGYLCYSGQPSFDELDPSLRFPLNNDYALSIIIRFGGFTSNLFSSKEEIVAEKNGLLYEFLDNMRLTYPPDILQQIKPQK